MRIRALLIIGFLFSGIIAMAQDQSSARSEGSLYLEFRSAPATITWVAPTEFSTIVKEKVYTLKVGIDSEADITGSIIYVNDIPAQASRGFKKGNSLSHRFKKFVEQEVILQDGFNTIKIHRFMKFMA